MNYFPDEVCISPSVVPGEISLIIPLAGCGNSCKGCHSPHYQNAENGVLFSKEVVDSLYTQYCENITCIVFFNDFPDYSIVKEVSKDIPLGVFLGNDTVNMRILGRYFRYVKYGSYIEGKGGLDSKDTNQILFDTTVNKDITYLYRSKETW